MAHLPYAVLLTKIVVTKLYICRHALAVLDGVLRQVSMVKALAVQEYQTLQNAGDHRIAQHKILGAGPQVDELLVIYQGLCEHLSALVEVLAQIFVLRIDHLLK